MAFAKGENPNHPRKGSSLRVEPIRDLAVIARIKANLLAARQYRNYCLFVVGINTAWRANELLSIRVGQVRHLQAGDCLSLKQSKTGTYRQTPVNRNAVRAIRLWLRHHPQADDDAAPLFPSQRSGRLGVPALCNLVKRWCQKAGVFGQYQRVSFKAPLALISRAFGHASERQTLTYVGILPLEIMRLFRALL